MNKKNERENRLKKNPFSEATEIKAQYKDVFDIEAKFVFFLNPYVSL